MNIIHNIRQFFAPSTPEALMRSKQGVSITARLMRQTDALTKKDIQVWRQAWQRAINIDHPNRTTLYDIYADCMVDLHLTGCINQRKGKTLRKPFILTDKEGNTDAKAQACLEKEWFIDFLDLALDSRFWGHSLIQLGDVVNRDGDIRFNGVQLVPRKHVCPEFGVILTHPGDDPRSGITYRTGDFADWTVEVGKPDDLGLLLKCAPSCISKKNMLAFWDMFGETFGIPMRIARTATQDAKERRQLENAMEQMGPKSWIVASEGTDIEIKESSRGDAYNVYDRRVDRCNSELSKGILMQTMTIDNGSSLAQSETHLEIFEDVIEADARFIAYVINDRLLPLMARHGFPVKGCTFRWDNTDTLTPADRREMERTLLQHYNINPEYFRQKYNIDITGPKNTGMAAPHADNFFA